MAQIEVIELTDDIDGSEAHETLSFALEGKSYEIDLSSGNAQRLREVLAPFVQAGRRMTRKERPNDRSVVRVRHVAVPDAPTIELAAGTPAEGLERAQVAVVREDDNQNSDHDGDDQA